jgi:hypothetical protein
LDIPFDLKNKKHKQMRPKLYFLYLSFFFLFISLHGFAQQDTLRRTKNGKKILGGTVLRVSDSLWYRIYNPEQGYFQKANFDKSDPRFMIANENHTFKFGIGGSVKVVTFADFAGTIDNDNFITSLIPIPTNNYGQFRIFANQSRLNVKVVGKIKQNPVVAFIEGGFNGQSNAFKLRHAYVSFVGLTIGRTWTTFMDLQASPSTIDGEGPNNQIANRHSMIRYTYYYKDKLQVAVAAEMPEILMDELTDPALKIYTQRQHIPDFTTHLKFQGKFGHIQLGGMLRIMNYGDSTKIQKSIFVPGGGVSLSGTFRLWKEATLFYQCNGGKGIASYIQDLSLFNYDLLPSFSGTVNMNTVWMYGGYVAFQQYWTKQIHSNIVYGLTRLETPQGDRAYFEQHMPWYYRYGHYLAVNTFWNFFDFATVGIEYLWGARINLSGEKGQANRINLLLKYDF